MTSDFRQFISALDLVDPALLVEPTSDPEREREDVEARARREAADRRETHRRVLLSCGVPAKHAAIIAAGAAKDTPATTLARKLFTAGQHRVLVLLGAKDAGKTFAGAVALDLALQAWMQPFAPRAPAPRMISAELLVDAWMYYDRTERGTEPLEPVTTANKKLLLECSLLVIDDVGQEQPHRAESTGDALDILITRRSDAGLRTVLTGNFEGLDALLARYPARAERLGERFTEYGVAPPALKTTGMRRRARGEGATT